MAHTHWRCSIVKDRDQQTGSDPERPGRGRCQWHLAASVTGSGYSGGGARGPGSRLRGSHWQLELSLSLTLAQAGATYVE